MSQIYTILFDLDGTIIDTAPDLMDAHNHVMKKFGHETRNLSDIKKLAGKGAWIMMQRSFKEEITDEKLKKEMTKEFIDFYSQNIANGSKPLEGLVPFLDWARSKNISLAVCTKKLDLFKYFEYVAGADTFNYNKPDARHLTNAVEIIGGDLKKTMMVGDSEVDEMAASNAKVPFVLVEDGYTEKTIQQIRHDALIKNFIGFEKIVSKYL